MSRTIVRAHYFPADLIKYARWYASKRDEALAEAYLDAVNAAVALVALSPGLGKRCSYRHPDLANLRMLPIDRPFDRHLLFYRYTETTLVAFRAIHGMRNLRRRLLQPPDAD